MPNSKKLRLVLCLGSLSGLVWAGTFATFTDSGTAQSTFTAGSVDLLVSGEVDDAYAFTAIEMSNMKPGDVKYAPLTIANNGTLGFTYSMSTSATTPTARPSGTSSPSASGRSSTLRPATPPASATAPRSTR